MNVQKSTLCEFKYFVSVLLGITCGDPGMPMNGTVTSNGTYVTSFAEFTCNFGFELIGDTQRICQPNGMWSNMVPECRRKLLAVELWVFISFHQ